MFCYFAHKPLSGPLQGDAVIYELKGSDFRNESKKGGKKVGIFGLYDETLPLPPELESRVRAHVASGMFGSASEVIREALRLFESYQSMQVATLAALKADIEQGQIDKRARRVAPLNVTAIKAEGRKLRSARDRA